VLELVAYSQIGATGCSVETRFGDEEGEQVVVEVVVVLGAGVGAAVGDGVGADE